MKLIYLTVDGRERVENWKANARMVEEPDGYHPVTNDSVWQHDNRKYPARMVLIQGVTPPFGAKMAHEDMKGMLTEKLLAEHGFRRPLVSKMLWRMLSNGIDWFLHYGILLMIVIVIVVSVAYSLLGGSL